MSDNVTSIREAIRGARDRTPAPPPAPPDHGDDDGRRGGDWGGPEDLLPAGCPVVPLGVQGEHYFYLDLLGQLRPLTAKEHSRLNLQSLFGFRSNLLYEIWPRKNPHGDVTGWKPELAAESLMAACARLGVLELAERLRGPGAWVDEDGNLVLHCGDAIYVSDSGSTGSGGGGRYLPPGSVGRHIYPAAAPKPRPHGAVVPGGEDGPGHALLAMLRTWSWERPDVDPQLLLGWIGAALVGGALKWRPLAWITGDAATGKSTLHDLLRLVFDGALLSVSDASAAGIWQTLGHASLPIALDELEAEEDNRRAQNIIKLARQASSGGIVLRGGADHKGAEFTIRSCFLFSSILVPPLLRQDRSRMAILALGRATGSAPVLTQRRMSEMGAQLRRRLVDQWGRFAPTLEAYRTALSDAGHGGRGSDQFGTLLACADLLLHDFVVSSDELAIWGARLAPSQIFDGDDEQPDHERCLAHLMSTLIDAFRNGSRSTVGALVQRAAGLLPGYNEGEAAEANGLLLTFGLRVMTVEGVRYLDVANQHQGLAAMFAGTHWAARSGASGVWVQALRRIEGASRLGPTRFAGVSARATRVPVLAALPGYAGPEEAGDA